MSDLCRKVSPPGGTCPMPQRKLAFAPSSSTSVFNWNRGKEAEILTQKINSRFAALEKGGAEAIKDLGKLCRWVEGMVEEARLAVEKVKAAEKLRKYYQEVSKVLVEAEDNIAMLAASISRWQNTGEFSATESVLSLHDDAEEEVKKAFHSEAEEEVKKASAEKMSEQMDKKKNDGLESKLFEEARIYVEAKAASFDENRSNKSAFQSINYEKSVIERQKMIYYCKFGEFGILDDQFTEPSGVAVNAQNDIIVADANDHKIKIFDKEGCFKFQFGEVGKEDGQLLYPNRVAVIRDTGDIVFTERSATPQVQIYTKYGQFIRKFGATILQHPRGVCVDNMGRVIVVECKVKRVVIFDYNGNLLKMFGCSQYLNFPNGVVVNDLQEIFISDNRKHCVKVFDYDGNYLRQIGGKGVTNYPIGVGINDKGEITIADNHNSFKLTVFSQEGLLISALESMFTHAQCYDVAQMNDGSVVLASKDFKIYIYKYVQVPLTATELQI